MLRPLLSLASPAGTGGRLSVLVLHRVLAGPDPLFPEAMDASRFRQTCDWMKSMFRVLPLDEAVRKLQRGTLPACAAAITFDDGYADNLGVAMPILQQAGLPATVFITTGFLDGGCMWNDIIIESFRLTARDRVALGDIVESLPADRALPLSTASERRVAAEAVIAAVKYLEPVRRLQVVRELASWLAVVPPSDLMLNSPDVRKLRLGGLQIGAHTVTHPILTRLAPPQMRQELQDSKATLEQLTGESVTLLAYPNGRPGEDYDLPAVALARELGFEAAFTTVRGAAHMHTDPFQMPRFTPWDRTPFRFGLRMLGTLWNSRPGGAAPGPLRPVTAGAAVSS
jgi:peptidoglycan/xylan/chitin deacetylase (PgdA/CDA1 family)